MGSPCSPEHIIIGLTKAQSAMERHRSVLLPKAAVEVVGKVVHVVDPEANEANREERGQVAGRGGGGTFIPDMVTLLWSSFPDCFACRSLEPQSPQESKSPAKELQ